MCNKCIILTYDEVLDVIQELEVYAPLAAHPDWPACPVKAREAFPGSFAPVIVPEFDTAEPPRVLEPGMLGPWSLKWGFQESWNPNLVHNTRIESAAKPTWRDSMEHRRCILPMRAFFETHEQETYPSPRTGKPIKRPYEFRVPGQDVILVGATHKDGRFSMVTTEANTDMAPIHHRMPLIIRPDEVPFWLSADYQQLANRFTIKLEAEPVGEAPLTLF